MSWFAKYQELERALADRDATIANHQSAVDTLEAARDYDVARLREELAAAVDARKKWQDRAVGVQEDLDAVREELEAARADNVYWMRTASQDSADAASSKTREERAVGLLLRVKDEAWGMGSAFERDLRVFLAPTPGTPAPTAWSSYGDDPDGVGGTPAPEGPRMLPGQSDDATEALREHVRVLKRELANQHEAGRVRNRALDALQYVWCNGGCEGGVHRFEHRVPLTEEVVAEAERNVSRMRTWLRNHDFKPLYRAAVASGLDHMAAFEAAKIALDATPAVPATPAGPDVIDRARSLVSYMTRDQHAPPRTSTFDPGPAVPATTPVCAACAWWCGTEAPRGVHFPPAYLSQVNTLRFCTPECRDLGHPRNPPPTQTPEVKP